MKNLFFMLVLVGVSTGCASKTTKSTQEHRANPSQSVAYGSFVEQRTEQLQQMGGPFKDRAMAQQKAIEDADSRFGADSVDSVTTTWSTDRLADRARSQEQFTDKLDDMEGQKRTDK